MASIRDADIKLTKLGEEQAIKTGKYLATLPPFDICFCSPYRRAVRTAELIISQFNYRIGLFKDNRLREKEFGRLHGLDKQTVKERYPEEYKARERDGVYWYRFIGGENYVDVEMRINSFLESLQDYAGRSVLVVSHQVPFKMFRAVIQRLDESQVLELPYVPNCAMQQYKLNQTKYPDGRLILDKFNYVAYELDQLKKKKLAEAIE